MVADVLGHLRAISGQQSKIRGLRNKLAILKEAADKQEGATAELLLVRRIPAVYRQCLAECMRRCARLSSLVNIACCWLGFCLCSLAQAAAYITLTRFRWDRLTALNT